MTADSHYLNFKKIEIHVFILIFNKSESFIPIQLFLVLISSNLYPPRIFDNYKETYISTDSINNDCKPKT